MDHSNMTFSGHASVHVRTAFEIYNLSTSFILIF